MKTCTICKSAKQPEDFSFKNKALGKRQSACKICVRAQIQQHYIVNKNYYLQKAKRRNKKLKLEYREFIWNYLQTHPCVDCSEKDPVVLEFDHLRDKLFDVSVLAKNGPSSKRLLAEIEKCEVRCANCHRRKTAKDFGWQKLKVAPVA